MGFCKWEHNTLQRNFKWNGIKHVKYVKINNELLEKQLSMHNRQCRVIQQTIIKYCLKGFLNLSVATSEEELEAELL